MNDLKKIFKKVGGFSLIKDYLKAGVLGTAISQFIISGSSKKSLELVRAAVQLKIQNKLRKKYKYVLDRVDKSKYDKLPKISSNKVWVCWLQGIENAPKVVKVCYNSIVKNLSDRDIIVITEENYFNYVSFPDNILEKWKKGIITNTHFSDLLRLELLINYGGTWIDSTVLCTGRNYPKYILDSELFFYQVLKPGKNGHALTMSSWLITSTTNNNILLLTRELLYEYWSKNNFLIDYHLIHNFIELASEVFKEERENIVKSCNSIPHILLLDMFENYNKEKYEYIKEMTCFHKLNYKREKSDMNKKGTFFDVLINNEKY